MALIRRARADDAAGIAQVHVASWRSTYPGMVPDSYLLGLSTDAYTERWRAILSDHGRIHASFVVIFLSVDEIFSISLEPLVESVIF